MSAYDPMRTFQLGLMGPSVSSLYVDYSKLLPIMLLIIDPADFNPATDNSIWVSFVSCEMTGDGQL